MVQLNDRTVIITKIYEIRQSSRGWSGTYQLFFNKEKALAAAAKLQEEAAGMDYKTNFRVYEHTAGDMIVYNTSD